MTDFGTLHYDRYSDFGGAGFHFRVWNINPFFSRPKLKIVYEPDVHPNTYCPVKDFTGYTEYGPVKRKYLRIKVENTGRGIAAQCTAKLSLLENNSDDSDNPEREPKILQWSTENNIKEDISARKGFSVLNVVFSYDQEQKGKFAFVGTKMSLNGPNLPRIEDGFSTGNFIFEIVITTLHGYSTSAKFKLNVTTNWRQLSMKKIDEP